MSPPGNQYMEINQPIVSLCCLPCLLLYVGAGLYCAEDYSQAEEGHVLRRKVSQTDF